MKAVYYLSILFYTWIVRLVSPFNNKAKLWIDGRKDWKKKLAENMSSGDRWIWFHCASLGEFEQGRPVIEKLKEKDPAIKILLTFFSPSGYEVRKNYAGADYICYLPADFPSNASFFIKTVRPEMAVFVKYEFWYYFINQLHKSKIPVILISAIFRPDQIFFKDYGRWYRKILLKYNHIFVQDKKSEGLLKSAGVSNVTVAGDTRFDRVWQIFQSKKDIPVASRFSENAFVVVAGSSWKPDEEMICRWINRSEPEYKLIIAPHLIDEDHLKTLEAMLTVTALRFSQAEGKNLSNFKVLIIDNIGMLSSLYQYGKFAYIGGGFGVGIHNVLEAAVFGIPVVFGPNHRKFSEALRLIDAGGAFPVSTDSDFNHIFQTLTTDPVKRTDAGKKAGYFVSENIGATDVAMKYLLKEK